MRKFFKNATIATIMLSFIGIMGASKADPTASVVKEKVDSHLISSRALIQNDFSGVESGPIIRAFVAWMSETNGDVLVLPPTEQDAMFFDLLLSDDEGNVKVFEMDLENDIKVPEPWSKACRQTFYVLRITSKHSVVKTLDGTRDGKEILAFTFAGCKYKFIAVVADRMRDENLMYTTMLHELGHMWGLSDNTAGRQSIMNGSWPGANCITKKDIHDLYDLHHKGQVAPSTGCVSEK